MGSEYPSKGERRLTADPLRHFPGVRTQRKLSSTGRVSGIGGSGRVSKTALTPISRLKKFQKLRDRNLRRHVLDRNRLTSQFNMLETVESATVNEEVSSSNNLENVKVIKKLGEDAINGINGISEEKEEELEMNGVEVKSNGLETNGEVEHAREDTLHQAEEEIELVENDCNGHSVENQVSVTSHEDRELEVEVTVVESRASTSSRRATPRRSPRTSPRDSTASMSTLPLQPCSSDDVWRSDSLRISGRRPIHPSMTPPLKRKSEEFFDEPASKRQAFTPSVPSPGWKFLSPFSLFHRRIPGPAASARPTDDSLFVNVSTDSEPDLDTTADTSSPQEDPSTKPSWLCSIM